MSIPRDFVREPATWAPIQVPGQATFRELLDVLADHRDRRVALVGTPDPEMGPYSRCITVPAHEADTWCARGYRTLTDREDDASIGVPVDLDHATD
jgi:hypothetical protein